MYLQNALKNAAKSSLWASILLSPVVGSADEVASETAEMEGELAPYVVVATRTPLGLDRVSPSVDYISQIEMEGWQDRDLVDVLEKQPGMVLISSGATGAQTSLFTRGTESNHTAFFLDGRRLNSGFGNQYDLELLSIGNLGSVQVQRGASSVNYGSSGIGGAIDLRTQSALDNETPAGSLEAEVGANGYRRGAFSTSVASGDLGVSLAGSALSTDNERANDEYESRSINSRFDYRLSDSLSLELLGQYSESEKGLPGAITNPKLNDEQEVENWLISPGLRYATDELSAHLFYSHTNSQTGLNQIRSSFDDFWNYLGDFSASNVIELDSDEVSLQVDYSVTDDLLISGGLIYRKDEATNSNLEFDPLDPAIPYAEEFEQYGAYAQAMWLIGDLELRGGLRYDDYSEFDSETTGSVEVLYHFSDYGSTVFAKFATSYAPPGAADIAFDVAGFDTPLSAEQSRSYELGFRQTLLEGDLVWSILGFKNQIDDMLGYNAIEVAPFTYEYDTINVKSAKTEGVEFEANYAVTKKVDVSLGYTYLTAVDEDSDTRLSRRPRHMLQIGVDYQVTDDLHAGLQAIGHFDREDIDPVFYSQGDHEDFFVVRLVVDWAVSENVVLFGRVENLLDESYEPAAGFPALGRAGYIGARYTF